MSNESEVSSLSELEDKLGKIVFPFDDVVPTEVIHQSIEIPAPRPPGHSGEFNIYSVLKDGLFPRPLG